MDAVAAPCPADLDHRERIIENPAEISPTLLPSADGPAPPPPPPGPSITCAPTDTCEHICDFHTSTPKIDPIMTHARELFRKSLLRGSPRYRILVRGEDYLVGKPIFTGFGMVGRGTRCYVALEWHTQRLVMLKDSWRPSSPGIEPEGAILKTLNDAGVTNVPTLVAYEDVRDVGVGKPQETATSNYSPLTGTKKGRVLDAFSADVEEMEDPGEAMDVCDDEPPTRRRPPTAAQDPRRPNPSLPFSLTEEPATTPTEPRLSKKRKADEVAADDMLLQGSRLRHPVHSRIVVEEICLPLTAFTHSEQLVRLVRHCVIGMSRASSLLDAEVLIKIHVAHEQAWNLCNYVHRDVSVGNILIYPTLMCPKDGQWAVYWKGILSDWELGRCATKSVELQPERTVRLCFCIVDLGTHAYVDRELGNSCQPTSRTTLERRIRFQTSWKPFSMSSSTAQCGSSRAP